MFVWRKSFPDRELHCQGPKGNLACSVNSQETHVARAEWLKGWEVGGNGERGNHRPDCVGHGSVLGLCFEWNGGHCKERGMAWSHVCLLEWQASLWLLVLEYTVRERRVEARRSWEPKSSPALKRTNCGSVLKVKATGFPDRLDVEL